MPLTLSEQRYEDIRRRVAEAELQRSIEEAMSESGEVTFSGVDQLFEHLDALVERSTDQPRDRDGRVCDRE